MLGSCSFVSGERGLTWQGLPASCFVILALNETLTFHLDREEGVVVVVAAEMSVQSINKPSSHHMSSMHMLHHNLGGLLPLMQCWCSWCDVLRVGWNDFWVNNYNTDEKSPFLGWKKICNPEVWNLSSHSDWKKTYLPVEGTVNSIFDKRNLPTKSISWWYEISILSQAGKYTLWSTPLRQEILSHKLLKKLMKIHRLDGWKSIPSSWIKIIPCISSPYKMKFHPIGIWKFCKIIHMNSIP